MTKAIKILGRYHNAYNVEMVSLRRKHDDVTHYEIHVDGDQVNSTTDRKEHQAKLIHRKHVHNYKKVAL